MLKNSDMPAMPIEPQYSYENVPYTGLTKREHFAGLAMQGLLLNLENEPIGDDHFKGVSTISVSFADALLKALEND